jgi:SAM-dependent methyltransferase
MSPAGYPYYIVLNISRTAILLCKRRFVDDPDKRFYDSPRLDHPGLFKFDLLRSGYHTLAAICQALLGLMRASLRPRSRANLIAPRGFDLCRIVARALRLLHDADVGSEAGLILTHTYRVHTGGAAMGDYGELTYKNRGNVGLLDLLCASPGRILDCGCGAGDNARILSDRGWRVTAVTIDPQEYKAVRPFCEAVHLADLENGLPAELDGAFDAVLASHVLEHLSVPERLLHEVRERLAPGGVLAVALPNIAHYRQRFSLLRGQFRYTETGQLDRTHLRFYTHTTAIQLLEQNGYELVAAEAEGALPWWKTRSLVPPPVVVQADRWAVRSRPNLWGHQSLLVARPSQISCRTLIHAPGDEGDGHAYSPT